MKLSNLHYIINECEEERKKDFFLLWCSENFPFRFTIVTIVCSNGPYGMAIQYKILVQIFIFIIIIIYYYLLWFFLIIIIRWTCWYQGLIWSGLSVKNWEHFISNWKLAYIWCPYFFGETLHFLMLSIINKMLSVFCW